jgi:hypothetical protein
MIELAATSRYACLMLQWASFGRLLLVPGLLACLALSAHGQPCFLPIDPPIALVQADPGRTTLALSIGWSGWEAELARSVTAFCDVAAVVGSGPSFALRVRLLVAPSLFPLQAALEVGTDRVAALGALHLGPIRLVGDRSWSKTSPRVRLALHAAASSFATAAGAEWIRGFRPFISASWLPNTIPLSSLTLLASASGCRVTVGATW